MGRVTAAKAYCNDEIALIAWMVDAKIEGCLGFEVTRVYVDKDGQDAVRADGSPDRIRTASFVPFKGQRNPLWLPQDSGIWPVQKLTWRDLTLRRRRDALELRSAEVRVRYEIRPVGEAGPGLTPVPQATPANAGGQAAYEGRPRPLAYLDGPATTNVIHVTGRLGPFRAAFTNGILSAQWLSNVLLQDGRIEKGELEDMLREPGDRHREYLAGSVLPLLRDFLKRPGRFRLALYELDDRELLSLLLDHKDQLELILSNTGKGAGGLWDARNAAAREALRSAGVTMQDRMFNNSVSIGHNKFVVNLDAEENPQAVLTGSTNWTWGGLAAQTNNALEIEDKEVAKAFDDYWKSLRADALPVPNPLSTEMPGNVQGAELRSGNRTPFAKGLGPNGKLTLWFAPNMPQRRKGEAVPPDLNHVYRLIRRARKAIFFLAFYPGQSGKDCVVGEALSIGLKDSELLIIGAVSDPKAMPNYDPQRNGGSGNPPTFVQGNLSIVRASRIEDNDIRGDFKVEPPPPGHAIIHDKILVVDPLSDDCAVVLGSHNLGYKASYANDENMVIVEGHRALAEAYMVHVLDVFEHYRFRAYAMELAAQGKTVRAGYLQTSDRWQDGYTSGSKAALARYLAGP
ncbi:phospholipase D-like domain-containing protein [Azospirillum tabaci]|uniref:phospholipase D-like domain-containing protein n=1 Tax=Azospirillum tabaci TaxID=2752310 RepID=UPI001660AF68|nr:phospholipase D-like domain-containing protein [Azospirillum tabaci]